MSFFKDLISDNKDAIIDKIFDDELQEKLVNKLNANVENTCVDSNNATSAAAVL